MLPPHAFMARSIHRLSREGEGAPAPPLRQLVVAFAEAGETHRKADAFLRRLEDDESRGRAAAQFADEGLVHDYFGDAAVGQAAHEAGAADVDIVDLEAEARRQQNAE